jgi:hypothetical protein
VGGWGPGVHPTLAQIQNQINTYPGRYPDGTTWLIGNEIIWDDQRTPLQYAQDYHAYYYGLKAINPTVLTTTVLPPAFGPLTTST